MNQQIREQPGLFMRVMIWLMPKITPVHVWMYRKLHGRFVNRFTAGTPVLLVTTVGRRSGLARTVALGYLADGDAVVVAGTNGGKPTLPAWFLNLQANPTATVEIDRMRTSASAEFLVGAEWEQHWQRLIAAYPIYAQAGLYAGRKIPLVRLAIIDCRSIAGPAKADSLPGSTIGGAQCHGIGAQPR
jgi:deazaflavin-dependent oxidoreductase (nitroreductase family)